MGGNVPPWWPGLCACRHCRRRRWSCPWCLLQRQPARRVVGAAWIRGGEGMRRTQRQATISTAVAAGGTSLVATGRDRALRGAALPQLSDNPAARHPGQLRHAPSSRRPSSCASTGICFCRPWRGRIFQFRPASSATGCAWKPDPSANRNRYDRGEAPGQAPAPVLLQPHLHASLTPRPTCTASRPRGGRIHMILRAGSAGIDEGPPAGLARAARGPLPGGGQHRRAITSSPSSSCLEALPHCLGAAPRGQAKRGGATRQHGTRSWLPGVDHSAPRRKREPRPPSYLEGATKVKGPQLTRSPRCERNLLLLSPKIEAFIIRDDSYTDL